MKTLIQISVIATSILISGITYAKDSMGMACDQSQKMMEKRMEMMKSDLKLNAEQEKAFAAYTEQKKSLMKDMMKQKQAGMKGKGNSKNMHSSKMDKMQGKKDMQAQQGMRGKSMMGMMSNLSFEERMNFMQKHAEKMTATSKAGKNFFNSLTKEQKKKLNGMAKNMKGMDGMGKMNMK